MIRFHDFHSKNIVLSQNSTVACRTASYAHSMVFSENPLLPGEIFLVEIEKKERGWSGHMRIGLTLLDPNTAEHSAEDLPKYSLPDLVSAESSWLIPISILKDPSSIITEGQNCARSVLGEGPNVLTPRGLFSKEHLRSREHALSPNMQPMDVGSRIGVMFVPCSKINGEDHSMEEVQLHFIVNGISVGPYTVIPYTGPLHAVVDVYGTTKQVKIIQLYEVPSLQSLCRDFIMPYINKDTVKRLPLPQPIRDNLTNYLYQYGYDVLTLKLAKLKI